MQAGAQGATVSEPKRSATIMLLRDKAVGEGLEVFMLQRHRNADFGNAFVFPGGLAAKADYASELAPYCFGLDDRKASAQLGLASGGLAFWVAAIRECFEESGYLLACDFRGNLCQPGAADHAARFRDYRHALDASEITLAEVCAAESLTLTCNAIEYVSFWTTPVALRRRYATRFFVAAVPEGQDGAHDGRETVASRWVCPVEATEGSLGAALKLHPPTRVNLEWLAQFSSVNAAMTAARQIDKTAIREILPVVHGGGDKVEITLPTNGDR